MRGDAEAGAVGVADAGADTSEMTERKLNSLASRLHCNVAAAYLVVAVVYAEGAAKLRAGSGGKAGGAPPRLGCAGGVRVQREVLELALERCEEAAELDGAWEKPGERRARVLEALAELDRLGGKPSPAEGGATK
jgi:hypothetical protein